jgi:hypothetical protein
VELQTALLVDHANKIIQLANVPLVYVVVLLLNQTVTTWQIMVQVSNITDTFIRMLVDQWSHQVMMFTINC